MFKKRRQRARKYTLVSYGTGELERDEDEGEEGEVEEGDKENTFEVSLLATSESEIDEDFFSDIDNDKKIVTFDWDSGLLEVEKKTKSGDEMQTLPETTGKGALMFARRRQRMDQITAEQEEMKARTVHAEEQRELTVSENFQKVSSSAYQTKEEEMLRQQPHVSKSYADASQNHGKIVQQNGFGLAPDTNLSFQSSEAQKAASLNRTAKPFPFGVQNRAAAPFSPTRNVTSPLSDLPAPPPYCSISPPPEALYRPLSAPAASKAAPILWSHTEPTERIASRDERIAVPAKRTGILQEAKRRSTSKPMFSFKEAPKVSPNPALLSLVHNAEGKKVLELVLSQDLKKTTSVWEQKLAISCRVKHLSKRPLLLLLQSLQSRSLQLLVPQFHQFGHQLRLLTRPLLSQLRPHHRQHILHHSNPHSILILPLPIPQILSTLLVLSKGLRQP